jgi:hypothetical protein
MIQICLLTHIKHSSRTLQCLLQTFLCYWRLYKTCTEQTLHWIKKKMMKLACSVNALLLIYLPVSVTIIIIQISYGIFDLIIASGWISLKMGKP